MVQYAGFLETNSKVFDRELANAIQGITTSLSAISCDVCPIWGILRHVMQKLIRLYQNILKWEKQKNETKRKSRIYKKERRKKGKQKELTGLFKASLDLS